MSDMSENVNLSLDIEKNQENKEQNKKLGVYIHIPFCIAKCLYCDFCSFANNVETTDIAECHDTNKVDMQARYAQNLKKEIRHYGKISKENGYTVDTVFFGGGTPTHLKLELLLDVFDTIKESFNIEENAEISTETNPAANDYKVLNELKKRGFNRLSIGLQSANLNELKLLGRVHTLKHFEKTMKNALKVGFNNINIDLMYGIPQQTLESFQNTLEYTLSFSPTHISMYGLKIEEGTPFYRMKDDLVLPDEDTEFDMYHTGIEILKENGFYHYEISNYAKIPSNMAIIPNTDNFGVDPLIKGNEEINTLSSEFLNDSEMRKFECKHNKKYWTTQEYIGLGVSAHSYFLGRRYANTEDFDLYCEKIDEDDYSGEIFSEDAQVSVNDEKNEYIMLKMRLCEGVNVDEYNKRFGCDFYNDFGEKFKKYLEITEQNPHAFIENIDNSFRFTDSGMYLSNYILSDIVSFE